LAGGWLEPIRLATNNSTKKMAQGLVTKLRLPSKDAFAGTNQACNQNRYKKAQATGSTVVQLKDWSDRGGADRLG